MANGIGKLLRSAGGALNPDVRRENIQIQALDEERNRLETTAQLDAKRQVRDFLQENIQRLPENDPRRQNFVQRLEGLNQEIVQLGGEELPAAVGEPADPTQITPERATQINQGLDRVVSTLPESVQVGLSADLFADPTKRREAVLDARREAQKGGRSLEERLIAQLPEGQRQAATMALLNKKLTGSQSEFERITDDLVARNVITQDEADKLSAQKLATDATGESRRITMGTTPEGENTLIIEEGRGDLGQNPITANRIDDLTAQKDFLDRGVNMLEETIADPQKLGAVASIARTLRTGKEISVDLASTFPGAGRVIDGATQAIESVVAPDDQAEAGELFSPSLDQLSLLENSLGLLLARTRVPNNRIPVDVIKRSIDDVGLTGLRGDQQVRNRLEEVLRQLKSASGDIERRIPGDQPRVINFEDLP